GLHPRYYRPPFFSHTPSMDQQLTDMGYVVVLGDVGARDWDRGNSSESIVEEIIRKTLKGKKHQHIILLHDGRDVQIGYPRQNVIEALPQIIRQLKERGYRFVTVEQMIHQSPYLRPQSYIWWAQSQRRKRRLPAALERQLTPTFKSLTHPD